MNVRKIKSKWRAGLLIMISLMLMHSPFTGLSGPSSASAAGSTILNGGFEDVANGKAAGWNAYEAASNFELVGEPVRTGSFSMKLADSDPGKGNGVRSEPVAVTPGESYSASVFGCNDSGTSELYLEFWNSSNQRIAVQRTSVPQQGQWHKVEITAAAPQQAVRATLLLYQSVGNVGIAYFDDAAFSLVDSESLPFNRSFEMVENGKPMGWTPLSAAVDFRSETTTVLDSTYSVKMVDPSSDFGPGLRSGPIPVTPDELYRASVHSYNESGTSQIYMEFWDATNNRIDVKIASNGNVGEWYKLMLDAYAPLDASYATILLYQHKTNIGVAYFDDAAFERMPPEPVREFPLQVNGHPRQYFTSEDLPELRARANDNESAPFGATGQQLWQAIESNAELYLKETEFSLTYYGGKVVTFPLPPVQPDPMPNPPGFTDPYPYWTMMTRGVQDRLETLSLAYAVTQVEDYADKAEQYLLSVAGWDTWTDPTYPCGGYSCLDTAHLTFGTSMALDILYDRLSEESRLTVLTALEEKGLSPLYKDVRTKLDHNIQTLRAAALGSGAVVLKGHSPNADAYLTRSMDYYQWYLDERIQSGKQEGLLYTSYAMDNMIKAFDHIDRATGVRDLAHHPFLNDFLVRWVVYALAPGGGGLANFSDSGTANYFGLTMNVINSWLHNGQAGWYLKETESAASGMTGFLYFRPDALITPPDEWPASTILDEIGWTLLRSGWENDDVLFAMTSNNSRLGHNHYDQNSFQLATNRSWIAGDPGYQDYVAGPVNDFTVRLGHSTIQVDGKGQDSKGGGVLTKGLLSPSYDYVKGSAADAYRNTDLTQFDRHVVYLKPGTFVMLDELNADTPHVYDWVLYSGQLEKFEINGQPVIAGETRQGNELYLRNSGAELAAAFVGEGQFPITIGQYPGAESYGYTTKVGSGSAKTGHHFMTVLNVRPFEETGKFDESNLLPLTDSSGREVKLIQAAGSTVIFYRGQETGDYMTVTVEVPEDGVYSVTSSFLHSPLYGQVQVYVDDQSLGGVYDGYASDVLPSEQFEHGNVALTAGEHTIRYEISGKNELSGGYFIGLDALRIIQEGAPAPETSKLEVDAEWIQGSGAAGVYVERPDDSGIRDLVAFRTGTDGYTIADVSSDAQQAVVSTAVSGEVVGFKMTQGKQLSADSGTLLESTAPFSAALDADEEGLAWEGVVELVSAQTIRIAAPSNVLVTVNGQRLQPGDYTFDEEEGTIALTLDAGIHEIRLDAVLNRLSKLLDEYEASDDIRGPMVNPLRSRFRQIELHWNKGSGEQAIHHLDLFMDHLNKPQLQPFISEEAKSALNTGADRLMSQIAH